MNEQTLKYYLNNRNFAKKRPKSKSQKAGDRLQVVNDQIVLNIATPQYEEEDGVTSHTYLKKSASMNNKRWSKQEDEMFFESLECCGCEFSMMNILFPDRTRNNLKEKYKREYRLNSTRVNNALNNFKTFDMSRLMQLKDSMHNK